MSATLNLAPLRTFVDKTKRKRELEAELRSVNKEIEGVKEAALEEMADAGMSSVPFDDMTVYASKQIRAKVADQEAACVVLARSGYEDLVKTSVNLNTLSALLKEIDANGETMPPEFDGVIERVEFFDLRARSK